MVVEGGRSGSPGLKGRESPRLRSWCGWAPESRAAWAVPRGCARVQLQEGSVHLSCPSFGPWAVCAWPWLSAPGGSGHCQGAAAPQGDLCQHTCFVHCLCSHSQLFLFLCYVKFRLITFLSLLFWLKTTFFGKKIKKATFCNCQGS